MHNRMKGIILTLSVLAGSVYAGGKAHSLTVGEGFVDPLGFHDAAPTFSWKLPEGVKKQTAYHIQVKGGWDSGWIESDQSNLVPCGGRPFRSRQQAEWRVRYRDQAGAESGWSEWATFELGLLSSMDWEAQWIRPRAGEPSEIQVLKAVYRSRENPQVNKDVTARVRALVKKKQPVVASNKTLGGDPAFGSVKELVLTYREDGREKNLVLDENKEWAAASGAAGERVASLRRTFNVPKPIAKARLYVTARGVYEIELNGQKVGNDFFGNGWTPYKDRIDTLTYDVTRQLKDGDNEVLVLLGTGWYAGHLGWKHEKELYGRHPELLFQLETTYRDGSVQTMVSNGSWQGTYDGAIRSSSFYHGEHYDARIQPSGWQPVMVSAERGSAKLVPKPFAPVRALHTLGVRGITEPEPGRFVFDLGQNIVGWARIKLPLEKGQTVTLRFAEKLNPDGTMHTANYRSAKSTDTYTAAASGWVEWEPTFSFHGFQYVELSGLPQNVEPKPDWVTGVVLYTDLNQAGSFESSHEKLNQLQSNIVWGQRGNFLDIPTDCPQRDERLGWTGDARVFCPTSLFNYDCHAFWKSWLGSMRLDQFPDGRIPHVVPDMLKQGDSPGWMDAATMVPWEVYLRTGDAEVLEENFEMMEKLVGWYRKQSVDGLLPKIKGFCDWLQPYSKKTKGDTPPHLLGAAFYANSARILADSARILGRDSADRCQAEADSIKQAFARHYFDVEGRLQNAPETQTAYLLAIQFGLVPEDKEEQVVANLVRLIKEADGHLRTGFLGTPYIAPVLDDAGHSDLALEVLFKETCPSWFYSINQGATTMWERWNSYTKKDGFSKHAMNSLNHYAYGAIGQWMYERLAGLAPDPAHPGYKHFFIRPLIAPQLDWARAELETPYGKAAGGWKREGGNVVVSATVPPNTTATIMLPDGRKPETVGAGSYQFVIEGVRCLDIPEKRN